MLHLIESKRQREICACRILRDLAGIEYANTNPHTEIYEGAIYPLVSDGLLAIYRETKEKHSHDMDLKYFPQAQIVERLMNIPYE
jgi:hypothetical protein